MQSCPSGSPMSRLWPMPQILPNTQSHRTRIQPRSYSFQSTPLSLFSIRNSSRFLGAWFHRRTGCRATTTPEWRSEIVLIARAVIKELLFLLSSSNRYDRQSKSNRPSIRPKALTVNSSYQKPIQHAVSDIDAPIVVDHLQSDRGNKIRAVY